MTRTQVDRLVATGLAIIVLARLPVMGLGLGEGAMAVPGWWRPLAAAGVLAVLVALAAAAWRGTDPRPAAAALLVVTLLCVVTYLGVANGQPMAGTRPWISGLVPCAVVAVAVLLPAVAALIAGSAIAVLFFLIESGSDWAVRTDLRVDELAFSLVLLVAAIVLVQAAYTSAGRVEAARAASLAAYAEAAARRAEQREVHRWDSLVHDSVLATLSVAGRVPPDDADAVDECAELAQRGLDEMAADPSTSGCTVLELKHRLVDDAAQIAVGIVVRDAGPLDALTLPGPVAAALLDAAGEALRNAARHAAGPTDSAGSISARSTRPVHIGVQIRVEETTTVLVVHDDGVGFDPRAVPAARLGLQVSVIGRARAVGASAAVRSASGSGTEVTLVYPGAKPRHDGPEAIQLTGGLAVHRPAKAPLRAAVAVVAVLWISLQVGLGMARIGDSDRPALWVVAAVLVIAMSGWGLSPLVTGRVSMSARRADVFAAVTGLFGLLVDPWAHPSVASDYITWTPGVVGAFVAILVLRGRLRQAIVAAVLGTCVIGVPVVAALPGRETAHLTTVAIDCAWPIAWLVGSWCCLIVAARTGRVIAAYWAAEAEAEVRASSALRETALAAARRAELSEVVTPLLQRIARRDGLTDEAFRAECRSTEQQLRDDLQARDLLDDSIRCSVRAARRRGVGVVLRDDRPVQGVMDAPGVAVEHAVGPLSSVARSFVAGALDEVETGDVTVRMPPAGSSLSLVVVAAGADVRRGVAEEAPHAQSTGVAALAGRLSDLAQTLGVPLQVDAGDEDLLAIVGPPLT